MGRIWWFEGAQRGGNPNSKLEVETRCSGCDLPSLERKGCARVQQRVGGGWGWFTADQRASKLPVSLRRMARGAGRRKMKTAEQSRDLLRFAPLLCKSGVVSESLFTYNERDFLAFFSRCLLARQRVDKAFVESCHVWLAILLGRKRERASRAEKNAEIARCVRAEAWTRR